MNKKSIWVICGVFAFAILALLIMTFSIIKIKETNYNKFLNTMPSENYIEEDLEDKLLSRNIEVLESKKENDQIFYTVSIEYVYRTIPITLHYLVLYEATSDCVWVYKSHRLLTEFK